MLRSNPLETLEEPTSPVQKKKKPKSSKASVSKQIKNFILDTNVLLHDPNCLNRFENNHVFIPVEVLGEMDKFKNEQTERGANARTVHRFLTQIFDHQTTKVTSGVETDGGGTVRIYINDALLQELSLIHI